MKLDLEKTKVGEGKPTQTESFDIGNAAVIVEILRSKMYSDPIRTIVQEISSNGRDAHREQGNELKPIQIKLPNKLDSTFWVRDYGIGISPDRMSDVFLKYGNSTKRDSNNETGGFGLGAKSPFAYNDQYSIETYVPDEDGQVQRRRYVAVIDESRMGKLHHIDGPTPSDEERGTKIAVAVKPDDLSQFQTWVEDRCQYWMPLPKVIGCSEFEWPNVKKTSEGKGWFIPEERSYGRNSALALVDGIPYPVQEGTVCPEGHYDDDSRVAAAFRMGYVLEFAVGELTLTANREEIEYRPETIKHIRKRIDAMMDDVGEKVKAQIENADDLLDANKTWVNLPNEAKVAAGECEWNGCPVKGDFTIGEPFKVVTFERKWKAGIEAGTRRSNNQHFAFPRDEKTVVYAHDEDNLMPSRLRAQTLFNENADLEKVRVLVIQTDADDAALQKKREDKLDEIEKKYGVKTLVDSLPGFSTIDKYKAPASVSSGTGSNGGSVGPIIRVKELEETTYSYKWVEATDVTLDEEDEVIFVQLYKNHPYAEPNLQGVLDNSQVSSAQRWAGTVVGVQTPFIGQVPDNWVWLNDALKAKYADLIEDEDKIEKAFLLDQIQSPTAQNNFSFAVSKIKDGKVKPLAGGWLAQWIAEAKGIDDLNNLRHKVIELGNFLGLPKPKTTGKPTDLRIKVCKDEVIKRMPFLFALESRGWGHQKSNVPNEEIEWYIQTRDEAHTLPDPTTPKPKAKVKAKAKTDQAKAKDGSKTPTPVAATTPTTDAEKAYNMRHADGMTWTAIEKKMALNPANGMSAVRLARKHEKTLAKAATNP
jgi:hypothetical protein